MTERILLLTGHLAYPRLIKTMNSLGPTPFAWKVFDIGVKVAALMTEAIILRRVPRPLDADRIILPGRCRADLDALSRELGAKVERGPDEIADLPRLFRPRRPRTPDLSRYDIRIFSEIVDASGVSIDDILRPRRKNARRRCRRHRSRRFAGHTVPQSRRLRPRVESRGTQSQRRFGQCRRTRTRRRGGRGFSLESHRRDARHRAQNIR